MKILLGKSQIALRKCKLNNRTITAGQLKTQGTIENLIHFDEGYKFLIFMGLLHTLKKPRKISLP